VSLRTLLDIFDVGDIVMVKAAVHGVPPLVQQVLRQLRDRMNQLQLLGVRILNDIGVLLLVVNKTAAVRTCPVALVALVGVLAGVPTSVVYQIVRSLELFATEVACMPELGFMNQLMLLQRVFQLKRHSTVLTGEISHIRMHLEMGVIGRYLVESFSTLLTTPAVPANAVGAEMHVYAMPRFKPFSTLIAPKRSLLSVLEKDVELHVSLPVKLPRAVWAVVVDGQASFAAATVRVVLLVLVKFVRVLEIASTKIAYKAFVRMSFADVGLETFPFVLLEFTTGNLADINNKASPGFLSVDVLLVLVEVLVVDEVDIALCTPVHSSS